MTAYEVVLFLHFVALLLAIGAAGVVHVAESFMRRAETLGEAGRWGLLAKAAARAFPVGALALFGTGAYLTQQGWGWGSPWIVASIVGLVAMAALGAGVHGVHARATGRAIGAAIGRAGDGPVPPEIERRLADPFQHAVALAPTALAVGVVFVMTTKPAALGSALAPVVALAAAAVVGPLLARVA